MLKIAVLAPMPNASDKIASAVKIRLRNKVLIPKRMSCHKLSILKLPRYSFRLGFEDQCRWFTFRQSLRLILIVLHATVVKLNYPVGNFIVTIVVTDNQRQF